MYVVQVLDPRIRSFLMAQNSSDKSTLNDPSIDAQTSILVLLSARAIGSLGFAVSLLVIWFGWLLPTSLTAPSPSDISEIKKPRPVPKHQRRSVSSPTRSTPVRRSSAPIDLAPILMPHPHHDSSRRVSFADTSLSSSVTRRNTMPEPNKSNISLSPPNSLISIPRQPSPISRPGTSPNGCLDDLHAHDSDSSLTRPSRLQKLKLGFNLKTHRQPLADKQSDRDSITSIESTTSEKATKRTGGGFVAAWSNSRSCTIENENEPGSSRLSFVRLLSPTTPSSPRLADMKAPTSKAERRGSMPIPRTYPYGAPYFASPPVLLDKKAYPGYLKALPQFEDEIQFSSARASERGREPATRKESLYPSRRTIPKRRSASEDWTVRSSTNS